MLFRLEDFDLAIDNKKTVLELVDRNGTFEPKDVLGHLQSLSIIYSYAGYYDQALDCDKNALLYCISEIGDDCFERINLFNSLAADYFDLGQYNSSLEYYSLVADYYEKASDYPMLATIRKSMSEAYCELGEYDLAIHASEQAISIMDNSEDLDLSLYLSVVDVLGYACSQKKDYKRAIAFYENALLLIDDTCGKNSEEYITRLISTALLYCDLEDTSSAKKYKEEIDEYNENGLITYGLVLLDNRLAELLNQDGSFSESMDFAREAAGLIKGLDEKDNLLYLTCMDNLANGYAYLNDPFMAIEYRTIALNLNKELFGTNSSEYALCLCNMASDYLDCGKYDLAFTYAEEAIASFEQVNNCDPANYAFAQSTVAQCYMEVGNYAAGAVYYESAKDVLSKLDRLTKESQIEYARILHNTAICLGEIGQIDRAINYAEESSSTYRNLFGEESMQYIDCLTNLSNRFSDAGNLELAKEYLQHAIHLSEKHYGKHSQEYVNKVINLGNIYCRNEEYANAMHYYEDALSITDFLETDHPDLLSRIYNNMSICLSYMGNYMEALSFEKESLKINRLIYNGYPDKWLINLYVLGGAYLNLHQSIEASSYYSEFVSTLSLVLKNAFSFVGSQMQSSYWDRFSRFMTNGLYDDCVRLSTPVMNRTAFDGALLGKGLLLNAEMEMRKIILESSDEEALRMYNEIQESRIRLDKIYEDPVGKKELIDSLNNDIETRQQELMKRSKAFGDYTRNLALKWTDVQSALGKKDIAIEFETYTHKDTTFYIALTLRPGYTEPHLVELFNSEELKQVRARYDKTTGMRDYYSSNNLSGLVWGKLESEMRGIKNVYFSPAGELHNIGIEYLLDKDGKHLVSEKRNFYRLTSTRELAKEHLPLKISDATVYGGIRYDVTPVSKLTGSETESELLAQMAARTYTQLDSLSVTRGGSGVWDFLEGSEAEAQAVSSTLTSMRVRNVLLEGENGTEESFKALSGSGTDIIHISTHGFYWQSEKEAAHNKMNTSSFMLNDESRAPKEDKALTRSGLLFAGAQNAFDGKDIPLDVEDGILTAKDISRMDLRSTDLVVLSACQTGLGEVSGDGVFGLQRGFKKAGVKSIIMSLWKVDDIATKVMMTQFYKNLAKGKSKYDAFHDAQKYLRHYVDEEGRTYDEPEYYAAFVLLDAINDA